MSTSRPHRSPRERTPHNRQPPSVVVHSSAHATPNGTRRDSTARTFTLTFITALALLLVGRQVVTGDPLPNPFASIDLPALTGQAADPERGSGPEPAHPAPDGAALGEGEIFTSAQGLEITVGDPITRSIGTGEEFGCVTATLRNTSGEQVRVFGSADWSVAPPGADPTLPAVTGFAAELAGTTLAPGDESSGLVCAAYTGPGRYTFTYTAAGTVEKESAAWSIEV